jgi:hypothetical protein
VQIVVDKLGRAAAPPPGDATVRVKMLGVTRGASPRTGATICEEDVREEDVPEIEVRRTFLQLGARTSECTL